MYSYTKVASRSGTRSDLHRSGTRSDLHRPDREQGRICIGRLGIGLLFLLSRTAGCCKVCGLKSWHVVLYPIRPAVRWYGLNILPQRRFYNGDCLFVGAPRVKLIYEEARRCHDQPCSWVFLNVTV